MAEENESPPPDETPKQGGACLPRALIATTIVGVFVGPLSIGLERQLAYLPPESPWAWLLYLTRMTAPLAVLFTCPGCLGGPVIVIAAFAKKTMRPYLLWGLVLWFAGWQFYALSIVGVPDLKTPGLERIVENAQPIIGAIERYKNEKGEYPPSLEKLIPDYLQAIPHTGALGHPDYDYRLAEPKDPFKHYELCVYTTWGFVFDRFVYWPEGNYPDNMPVGGGFTTLVDGWAYVHD